MPNTIDTLRLACGRGSYLTPRMFRVFLALADDAESRGGLATIRGIQDRLGMASPYGVQRVLRRLARMGLAQAVKLKAGRDKGRTYTLPFYTRYRVTPGLRFEPR